MPPSKSHFWRKLLGQVLPSHCVLCHETCPASAVGSAFLCTSCEESSFSNASSSASSCQRCALPLFTSETQGICGECLATPRHFDRTLIACHYVAPLEQLVLGLKFGHQLSYATFMAEQLSIRVRGAWSEQSVDTVPDIVCPVPLGAKRLQERGFNQSLEIARHLSHSLGLPLNYRLILRVRETLQQSGLAPEARTANLRRAFSINPALLKSIEGKHIAVIDDVITTGATLNEIARVLKSFGAARVSNYVFARTLRH